MAAQTRQNGAALVVRFHAPGDVRIEDARNPRPGPDELLLRVRACSPCGTDVKIRRYGRHRMVAARVMGHEIAGGGRRGRISGGWPVHG